MKPEQNHCKNRKLSRAGFLALAAGVGYLGIRAVRASRAKQWQSHMQRKSQRTALVTGASAGIGRAFALRLARDGYKLILTARRQQRLETLASECTSLSGLPSEILIADLSKEEGIARVAQRIETRDDIDLLVNNAGYDEFGIFAEIPIQRNIELINCLEMAPVRLTRSALPGMLNRRRGAVINVSSVGAFGPKQRDTIYVASKAFVNRFSESLNLELQNTGVRALAVCPGFTITEFHDAPVYQPYRIKERIPRWAWMAPEQVVDESLRALAEDRMIYIPGFLNRLVVFLSGSGLSRFLLANLSNFFPGSESSWHQPDHALDNLICPACHGKLSLEGTPQDGTLKCNSCQKPYAIHKGIPRFAEYSEITGLNRRFAGMYDYFSKIYSLFSKVGFVFIGTTEDRARYDFFDRLQPAGKVLEVSIGPGVNLSYLREYPLVDEVYGLDLSNGQLDACRSLVQKRGWPVSLFQGNAEELPFQDNSFDSVFHIGGINFFNDKAKAIQEMIRVAKPGARILICDENEKSAQGYEMTIPGFKQSFQRERELVRPPIDLVPKEMEDIRLDEAFWQGWFYCLEFRKPGGK